MSAVFEAIGDAVSGVVDAVGDAVEWVGDTVGKVVESVADDPLKAIAQVAAVATGNAWALPIIEGVDVLEEGGDLGDALQAAALTYAVQTGVGYAMDSFGAAGATDVSGSGTTQFFDDGSSIQFFDDGSRLVTDSSGAISSTPAVDAAAIEAAGVQPSGAETMPVPDATTPVATELPPVTTDTLSPENVPLVQPEAPALTPDMAAAPQYDTMEQLLADKGLMPDRYDMLPETMGNVPAIDRSTTQYGTIEDIMYDKGMIDEARYKELTGKAPVVDLSQPAGPMSDTTVLEGMKTLGGAALDYAKENPWTTAGIIGGGLAAAGAMGGPGQPEAPGAPPKKTYTYGQAPEINRTGLTQTRSAAAGVYSRPFELGQAQTPFAPVFQSSFQPVLANPAQGGSGAGIGSLPITFQQIGGGGTYDISKMSVDDIIRLQDELARKRTGG